MLNTIISIAVVGAISASGTGYLLKVEDASKKASEVYVSSAESRFKEYEHMIPGIVNWKPQNQ